MAPPTQRVQFRDTGASLLLDLVRGLAAVLVLADHTHHLFFGDIASTLAAPNHAPWLRLVFPLTSAGVQAVDIFFVLSGFLISKSVLRWMAQGTWSWRRYFAHRLVRLWIVLGPALLLCALWDALRIALTPHTGSLPVALAAEGVTWTNLSGNLIFLQTIRTPTFGSDRVLWSLAFEFWYYVLFPLGALALRRRTDPIKRLLYAVAFFAVAAYAGRSILALFPVWLLGTLLAVMRPPHLHAVVRWIAGLLYIPLLFTITVHPWRSHYFKQDYVLGLLTALLLWILLSARDRIRLGGAPVFAIRTLAAFSYSLYLLHYPLLKLAASRVLPGTLWYPDPTHLLLASGFATLALLYSWGTAHLTEFHNDRVRDAVERRLHLKPSGAPQPIPS